MATFGAFRAALVLALLALLLCAAPAFAQLQTGNVFTKATDEQGASLPGVTVTLMGTGAPQVQITNAEGEARFLGVPPGNYELRAELEGFSTLNYPDVKVLVGRNTTLELTLSLAIEQVITVK